MKARERMATSTGGANPQPVETFPQAEGKVRDVVAEKVGIGSDKQYEKEKYIVDNADTLTPKDFTDEKGILKDCNIDYTPTEYSNTYVKSKLDDVIKELEIIKNDI